MPTTILESIQRKKKSGNQEVDQDLIHRATRKRSRKRIGNILLGGIQTISSVKQVKVFNKSKHFTKIFRAVYPLTWGQIVFLEPEDH